MYTLHVHYPGQSAPAESRHARSGPEALELVPKLLADHPQCERVVVMAGAAHLFAVDRKGARLG